MINTVTHDATAGSSPGGIRNPAAGLTIEQSPTNTDIVKTHANKSYVRSLTPIVIFLSKSR